MRFALPLLPAEFEIPDDWWTEAGMAGFKPTEQTYRSTDEATDAIALRDIEPPFRWPEVPKDFRGFDRERMIAVLSGIAIGVSLPPVPLLILPALPDISRAPFAYRVLDGVHRFYASVAAGFTALPATVRECVQ
jgi:hypothetical protein